MHVGAQKEPKAPEQEKGRSRGESGSPEWHPCAPLETVASRVGVLAFSTVAWSQCRSVYSDRASPRF